MKLLNVFTFISLFLFSSFSYAACPLDAQNFWNNFRMAALSGNKEILLQATQFPFELHGQLDDDGVAYVDHTKFIKDFSHWLDADPGESQRPSSMREMIKNTENLLQADVRKDPCLGGKDQFRVGSFQFKRMANGWRFFAVFVE